MDMHQFEKVVANQLERAEILLISKNASYNPDGDKLAIFKSAAILEGVTPQAALAGMMAKHTLSVYGMCNSTQEFTLDQWDEKITDHINYLILLRAVLEENENLSQKDFDPEEAEYSKLRAEADELMILRDKLAHPPIFKIDEKTKVDHTRPRRTP